MTLSSDPALCTVRARQSGEPLIGTAVRHACHFVLSWPKREWAAEVSDIDGPPALLSQVITPLKGQAILTLKAGPAEEAGTLWLFPHGLRFDGVDPADYETWVTAALGGEALPQGVRVEARHTLMICGHGKRDVCCAMFGGDVLRALLAVAPPDMAVWEVSHMGGHRFAGTLAVQPGSQWYGLLTADDVPDLVAAIQAGDILSGNYRGNAAYPPPLQVAEKWGYDELRAAGQRGSVSLVNPHLETQAAHVEVSLTGQGWARTFRLHLTGEPYTFFPNSNSDATKERLIWRVERVERHGQDY